MYNGRPSILFVDSDENVREKVKSMLERELTHVAAQKDAKQAMDYLKAHPGQIDLIITEMDLHSLNGSGLDMIRMLKITQGVENIPFVLVLHERDEQAENDALDLGALDILYSDMPERLFHRRLTSTISFCMKPDYVNVMEEALEKAINQNSKSLGICLCRACRNDVITLSLNNIKPRYVSTDKGRIIASTDQLNRDYVPQILRALTESAEKIKKNPRHQI